MGKKTFSLHRGEALEVLQSLPSDSVDLVFCSPPYEDARAYGLPSVPKGEAWVEWSRVRFLECLRVSRGLVAWVVEGRTKSFRWSATPALLMADLHREGVKLRKPPAYFRVGIPGSGGPDWWRNDYEFIVCASRGRLPWSDPTAVGHPPKFPPGGVICHQSKDGRVNKPRPQREGNTKRVRLYRPPSLSNPGNVVRCHGGGGHLGSRLAHENEAPFPEKLAEAFVRCFCPEGGTVLDPFCGSGTTLAVAKRWGRLGVGIDIRQSQVDLTAKRLAEVTWNQGRLTA